MFNFEEDDLKIEIKESLERLIEYDLVDYGKKDKDKGKDKGKDGEKLCLTRAGILINSRGIDLDTYLLFKEYLENKRGKLTDLELITLLVKSSEGKNILIPSPQFNQITDYYRRGGCEYHYQDKMVKLVSKRGEDGKEIYQDILELDGEDHELEIEDYLSIKKALLLYDWIGDKEIKEIEEGYKIYGGTIRKLGEGFSWLADSLGGVAESLGWSKKENKKEELAGIKILSERLAWGVEEGELGLARLHIPGLGRSYVRALLREGYDDRKCLEELSEEALVKVIPKRLAGRIKRRFSAENSKVEEVKEVKEVKDGGLQPETVLEIDQHRPDRIIFMEKEIEVTARGFSLLYLLCQHKKEVVSYNNILDEVWKDDEDATYTRITHHIYKFRRDILDAIGNNKINKEKVKDIFKVVSGRGVMLNINDKELKIN